MARVAGEFIKTWDSLIDIERDLGILRTAIGNCCSGISKSSGGFIFKYL